MNKTYLGQTPAIRLERLRGQLWDFRISRFLADIGKEVLNALIDGTQVLVEETRLLAVDTEQVRSHVESRVVRVGDGKALSGELDGDDLLKSVAVELCVPAVFLEADVALHYWFVRCSDHLRKTSDKKQSVKRRGTRSIGCPQQERPLVILVNDRAQDMPNPQISEAMGSGPDRSPSLQGSNGVRRGRLTMVASILLWLYADCEDDCGSLTMLDCEKRNAVVVKRVPSERDPRPQPEPFRCSHLRSSAAQKMSITF